METTLNVHVEILEQVSAAAKAAGISRSRMIAVLIKKAMDDITDPMRMGSLVRYQERRRPEEQRPISVQLRVDEYEYFQDLRRLRKMSVSLILAFAVKKFLRRLISDKKTDNYRYQNYVVIREIIDNLISWRLIWGFPANIAKVIKFT
ncbi:MAG: hypothetical protein JW807_16100 [Spirochaetes bacterium]|nr:hypothetical protein [Spirochaetota bacterium]